mgnify:FL=1
MKFLIWALVLVLAWLWFKHHRTGAHRSTQRPPPPQGQSGPQAMVNCPVCKVHLPRSEAFIGRLGAYCSENHRAQHEA